MAKTMSAKTTILSVFLVLELLATVSAYENEEVIKHSACCSYPCQNGGICTSLDDDEVYECDCFNTGNYGKNCEHLSNMAPEDLKPQSNSRKLRVDTCQFAAAKETKTAYFWHGVVMMIKPTQDFKNYFLSNFKFLWFVVNKLDFLRHFLLKLVIYNELRQVPEPAKYRGMKSYPTWETYSNDKVYARLLPPIPPNCPTQMGVKGPKFLPSIDKILEEVLLRREFLPSPRHTNLLLPFYNQHFTHQFFNLDKRRGRPYQIAEHAIDLNHVYGLTEERQHQLRSHVGGKMKVHVINNEVFPPLINQTGAKNVPGANLIPEDYRFLFGHDAFTLMPTFLVFGTLWLREHNRICDTLVRLHPDWDDERIFQTARLVMIGITLQVTVRDYVQHLSGYRLQLAYIPELITDSEFSYHNQIHMEFDILYQMHSLVPDYITLNRKQYQITDLVFNNEPVIKAGLTDTLKTISMQYAGKSYQGENQGHLIAYITRQVMIDSRRLRIQSLNNYRKAFGLKPYKSFIEMTGEFILSAKLKELYEDIDAVELFTGLFCENAFPNHSFGKTLMKMIAPLAFRGVFSNPIGAAEWWKPSTFGGGELFKLVRETTLQDLICRNVEGICPQVSFDVPSGVGFEPQPQLKDGRIVGEVLMQLNRRANSLINEQKFDKLPSNIKYAIKNAVEDERLKMEEENGGGKMVENKYQERSENGRNGETNENNAKCRNENPYSCKGDESSNYEKYGTKY